MCLGMHMQVLGARMHVPPKLNVAGHGKGKMSFTCSTPTQHCPWWLVSLPLMSSDGILD